MKSLIWTTSIRIIHWVIAMAVTLNLFVLEEGDPPHRYLGYLAVSFVLWRLYLGIYGPEHIRFLTFPLKPSDFKNYLKGKSYKGHNPFASLTYIAMWLLLLALGTSGFMMGLDAFWGDERLEELHEAFSDLMQLLILAHLTGMVIDSIRYKRHTWVSMFHGKK